MVDRYILAGQCGQLNHISLPRKGIASEQHKTMANKTIKVTFGNEQTECTYRRGMRFYQFMSENALKDEKHARELFTRCNQKDAQEMFETIDKSELVSVKVSVKYDAKANGFKDVTMLKAVSNKLSTNTDAIIEWRNKKALDSAKAIDHADTYLAGLGYKAPTGNVLTGKAA